MLAEKPIYAFIRNKVQELIILSARWATDVEPHQCLQVFCNCCPPHLAGDLLAQLFCPGFDNMECA